MKKIIAIIPIAILFILLSVNHITYASEEGQYALIEYRTSYGGYYVAKIYKFNSPMNVSGSYVGYTAYSGTGSGSTASIALQNLFNSIEVGNAWFTNQSGSAQFPKNNYTMVLISGEISFANQPNNYYGSLTEFNPEVWQPPDEPKWWAVVWETFTDYMTNPVLGQWMDNLIGRLWGDDNEGTIAENVDVGAPTLAPTPTPIPYSTVVVPKTDIITGETVYETNYYYENPDGTPTVAPYPPTNSPSNDGGGNGNSYTPVNGEPFSIPRLNWLTSVDIGDDNYNGIDSIYEGIGSIDSIGSEYTDGLSAAQDATGTLPDSWLLLIGVAAAIPLIAGIISRFLS